MATDTHAELHDRDGRPALRFERVLAYPRERVWRALTSREELESWHPTPFELELDGEPPTLKDTRIAYFPPPHVPEIPDGRVLEYDPPRLLAYTWWDDELRFELSEHERGCLLELTHTFDDRFKAARDAAGWDLCLRALCDFLAQVSRPSQNGPVQRIPAGWSELNDAYQKRFGIAPEEATPPPSAP
jgi:uncharacterized protein YndB with AHSA1/START domain